MSMQTAQVSHLGGITISYRTTQHDDSKPTLVLLHSFMTSLGLYKAQFESLSVTSAANLIAVDLLGHGDTRINSSVEQFTYWDCKPRPPSRAVGKSLGPHTDESGYSCDHDIATSRPAESRQVFCSWHESRWVGGSKAGFACSVTCMFLDNVNVSKN